MATTIIPDQSTEEGKKLLEYKPGDEVLLTVTVDSVNGGRIMGEVTKCELASEEEADEGGEPGAGDTGEGEPAASPMKGGMPKALVIVAGGKPTRR
jgi:hypothetical protein